MTSHTTWSDLLRPGSARDFFARQSFPPFEPANSGFSQANRLWLAELSRVIYRHDREEIDPPPEPTRTSFIERAGLKTRRFVVSTATSTQALLVERTVAPQFAVLVFRGTEQSRADWITNFSLRKARWAEGPARVHGGFLRALDSVWEPLAAELARIACPTFYTGHSLGGALATLAGVRRAPSAVYTFGSPRVGDAAFATLAGEVAIYRIVDDADVVPRVPPRWFGFHHVGTLLMQREARDQVGDAAITHGALGPPKFLADHAPVNYVDRIPRPHFP